MALPALAKNGDLSTTYSTDNQSGSLGSRTVNRASLSSCSKIDLPENFGLCFLIEKPLIARKWSYSDSFVSYMIDDRVPLAESLAFQADDENVHAGEVRNRPSNSNKTPLDYVLVIDGERGYSDVSLNTILNDNSKKELFIKKLVQVLRFKEDFNNFNLKNISISGELMLSIVDALNAQLQLNFIALTQDLIPNAEVANRFATLIQAKDSLVEFKIYGTGYPDTNFYGVKLLLNALQQLQINSVSKNNFKFVIAAGNRYWPLFVCLSDINEKGADLLLKITLIKGM